MFLKSFDIRSTSLVTEIVAHDYRTADVFRKYGIEYCCGGRLPLETVCGMKGIEIAPLIDELTKVSRTLSLPSNLPFNEWNIDFLVDYIIHVHHNYLHRSLPGIRESLLHFLSGHEKKYPHYRELELHFTQLEKELLPHMRQEEEVIFPYLRQVAHAYEGKDVFAGLLVKTLRKPVSAIMEHDHEILTKDIRKFRELTSNYEPPPQACISHRVILFKLKELDNDLMQHIYLENKILFPRIIAMEKEVLNDK
jgi:regulator of cell morphogenesis and NO signaling